MFGRIFRILAMCGLLLALGAASFFATLHLLPDTGAQGTTSTVRILLQSSNREAAKYLSKGWSGPEPWGTWSTAKDVALKVPLGVASLDNVTIRVSYRKFQPTQNITWSATNSVRPQRPKRISPTSELIEFEIGKEAANRTMEVTVAALVEPTITPRSVGMGADDRELGIGIEWIEVVSKPAVVFVGDRR